MSRAAAFSRGSGPIQDSASTRLPARLTGCAWNTLMVVALLIVFGASATAQETGPEPGQEDPVGTPASYITLRSDDLMIGKFEGNLNVLDTNQVNTSSVLSTPIEAAPPSHLR